MLHYLSKRVLWAIPTLFLVSLAIFLLSQFQQEDPVYKTFNIGQGETEDPAAYAATYRQYAALLHQDLPLFYFSIRSAAEPDTLHRILPPERREHLQLLFGETKQWPSVQAFHQSFLALQQATYAAPDSSGLLKRQVQPVLLAISQATSIQQLQAAINQLTSLADSFPVVAPPLMRLAQSVINMEHSSPSKDRYWPAFHWYGFENQYHYWWKGFLNGQLGLSYGYGASATVWSVIRAPLAYTVVLNIFVLVISYFLAVPLGVAMARRKGQYYDRYWQQALTLLAALPTFGLGSLMIWLMATPGHGLGLVPGAAVQPFEMSMKPFMDWLLDNFPRFLLLLSTLVLHSLALLALQMRGSVLDVLQEDFIRTARAKGLQEDDVFWRHAYKNALSPLITSLGSAFPALFSGSLVAEYMFNYPGMGTCLQGAFESGNHPVLFAVMMMVAILTIVGNMVVDLLYALSDPRIQLGS
ncbi:MAG: ABC transporter permease [Saprospiraceae bacterium]|nr:ABC transporter permease [Saprospiraceae bacterium]